MKNDYNFGAEDFADDYRLITTAETEEDSDRLDSENSLRPQTLEEYIGQ